MLKLFIAAAIALSSAALEANDFEDQSLRSHSYSHKHKRKIKRCCKRGPTGITGPTGTSGPTGATGTISPNNIFVFNNDDQGNTVFPWLVEFGESISGSGSGITFNVSDPTVINLPNLPSGGGVFFVSVNLLGGFFFSDEPPPAIGEFRLLLDGSPVGLPIYSSQENAFTFEISNQQLLLVPSGSHTLQLQVTKMSPDNNPSYGLYLSNTTDILDDFDPPVGVWGITVFQIQ